MSAPGLPSRPPQSGRVYRDGAAPAEDADADDRAAAEASINAFLAEEGLPAQRGDGALTAADIGNALVLLGYEVSSSCVRFAARVALLRLDCLTAVEGELRYDAVLEAERSNAAPPAAAAAAAKTPAPPRTSLLGWVRHVHRTEGRSAAAWLRGGRAELCFTLTTFVEEALLVVAMRSVMARLDPLLPQPNNGGGRGGGGSAAAAAGASPSLSAVLARVVAPMFAMSLVSWPLRAVRTTVRVNCMADTTLPATPGAAHGGAPSSSSPPPPQKPQRRYANAWAVWKNAWRRMGPRSLLLNGLDVDVASRVLSLGLAWSVVQPATRWMRQVVAASAAMNRGAAAAPLGAPAAAVPMPLMLRLGQHHLFTLGVLLAVAGSVNALQRPFVVVRQRMALLPAQEAERDGAGQRQHNRRRAGCRYASGWDCAVQVWRREGAAGLFAGLPLCLLVSTVTPLLLTYAGYTTAPSFAGSVL